MLSRVAPEIIIQVEHATQEPYVRRACIQALALLSQPALAKLAVTISTKLNDPSAMVRAARCTCEALCIIESTR